MEADISIKSVFNEAAGSSKLYNTSPSNENENRSVGASIARVSDAHLNALYNTLFDPSLSDNHKVAMCLGYLTYNPEEGSKINNDNLYQAIELEDLLQSIRQEIAQRQITLSNSSNVRMLEKKLELAKKHSELLVKYKGEYIGIQESRRHVNNYIAGLRGASKFRSRINQIESLDDVRREIDLILDSN